MTKRAYTIELRGCVSERLGQMEEKSGSRPPRKPAEPLIQLQNVVKVYPTAAGEFTALGGITASFGQGEFVGIIGKSGAGKSTLVNMITGVDHLTAGEVTIDGVSVHHLNESQMALWRGRNVGVVYQSFELLSMLSLVDNIVLPMDFCGLYKPRESEKRALHLLKQVGLEEHARKTPARISGGQQQRVAIARALANDPPVIVADEPTGNLDSRTAHEIFDLFSSLVEHGKTLLVVTHDKEIAARAPRVIEMADGQIVKH